MACHGFILHVHGMACIMPCRMLQHNDAYRRVVHMVPSMRPVYIALSGIGCLIGRSLPVQRLLIVAGRCIQRPLQYTGCMRLHSKTLSMLQAANGIVSAVLEIEPDAMVTCID